VAAIALKAEELAAGLHVHRVVVHRVRPDLGEVEVIWR
jgi:hypothetical protein